jgi:hypothetical protein
VIYRAQFDVERGRGQFTRSAGKSGHAMDHGSNGATDKY